MQKVNEQMICSFAHWSPAPLVDRQTASLHLFPIHASPEYQSLLNCIYSTKTYKKDIKQIKTNLKRRRKTDQNSLQKHTIPCILCIPIPIASLTLEISERDPFLLRAREAHCTILPSLKLKRDWSNMTLSHYYFHTFTLSHFHFHTFTFTFTLHKIAKFETENRLSKRNIERGLNLYTGQQWNGPVFGFTDISVAKLISIRWVQWQRQCTIILLSIWFVRLSTVCHVWLI